MEPKSLIRPLLRWNFDGTSRFQIVVVVVAREGQYLIRWERKGFLDIGLPNMLFRLYCRYTEI